MKTFKSLMESLTEGFMRGDDARVIAKGHKYHGKMGVVLKSDKDMVSVRFVDGKTVEFKKSELEMVETYDD